VKLSHPKPRPRAAMARIGTSARRLRRVRRDGARRAREDAGLSLVEVLVASLIVGILAAVAIPALLGTSHTATDVQAKEMASSAATAAVTFASDHGYGAITAAELAAEEPGITTAPSKQHAYLSEASGSESGAYSVTAVAADGDELTISHASDGSVTRSCYSPLLKKGCAGSERSSW